MGKKPFYWKSNELGLGQDQTQYKLESNFSNIEQIRTCSSIRAEGPNRAAQRTLRKMGIKNQTTSPLPQHFVDPAENNSEHFRGYFWTGDAFREFFVTRQKVILRPRKIIQSTLGVIFEQGTLFVNFLSRVKKSY